MRHAGLLDARRHAEYFDRVSDAVRGYLGARFGFDGLESTSDEILTALRKQAGGFGHRLQVRELHEVAVTEEAADVVDRHPRRRRGRVR